MAEEPLNIQTNYTKASKILSTSLKMKGNPVALSFAATENDIPQGMTEIDKRIRHCMMVTLARTEGRVFYATADKHECNGGSFALGLRELTPTLKTGEFYFKLGKFASAASSKRTMDSVPHLPVGETYATMYAPLEKTPFTPQIILVVTTPWAMLKLAQASLFRLGGRAHAEFSGIQSVCSDATARVYLTGTPNFSLGCDGSRRFSGIVEEEMIVGFPAEMLSEIVGAVQVITQAPGSSGKGTG
ncbi:MAG: DUF169 domain-containing protein [Halobacteriota archaeon]